MQRGAHLGTQRQRRALAYNPIVTDIALHMQEGCGSASPILKVVHGRAKASKLRSCRCSITVPVVLITCARLCQTPCSSILRIEQGGTVSGVTSQLSKAWLELVSVSSKDGFQES